MVLYSRYPLNAKPKFLLYGMLYDALSFEPLQNFYERTSPYSPRTNTFVDDTNKTTECDE